VRPAASSSRTGGAADEPTSPVNSLAPVVAVFVGWSIVRETAWCYLQLVRAGILRWSTYRQAMFAGAFTNSVFGFLRTGVILTVFAASAETAGYDRTGAVTFVWIGQALLAVVMIWGGLDIAERVRTGDIAMDLARPLDLQLAGLAQEYGRALVSVFYRGVFPFLVGFVFFTLRIPSTATDWLLFVASVVLGIAVSFAARFIIDLTAFWILENRGVLAFYGMFAAFVSGMTLPVGFFPHWLQVAVWCTPFPAILQVPLDTFVHRHSTATSSWLLLAQVGWAVLLLAAGRLVLRSARTRLVVQGG
jgi:ABC-2 type transport system permease protein